MRNIYSERLSIKKGSIIIEYLCAAAILTIIFLTASYMLSKCLNESRETNDSVKEDFYIKEAVIFIENEILLSKSCSIDENKNIISITQNNGDIEKIKLNSDLSLVISYYNFAGKFKATNVIAKNIVDFKLTKSSTYYVIYIKGKYKGEIKKCIKSMGLH